MMQLIIDNKEVLSLCGSLVGILLSLAFGGILSWRHKICLECESRRDVAINILRDRFVQRTSSHYADVAKERRDKRTEVEEIYKRPEQQNLVRELARDLEEQNRVKRLYRWMLAASQVSFGFVWAAVVIILLALVALWFSPPAWLVITWMVLTAVMLSGFVGSVSLLWYLDGRFFGLVNRIIEPEGEST